MHCHKDSRYAVFFALAVFTLLGGFVVVPEPALGVAMQPTLNDNFQSYPVGQWREGSTHGNWYVEYDGYGWIGGAKATTAKADTRKNLVVVPKGDRLRAAKVVSVQNFGSTLDFTVRYRTGKQLLSTPKAWQTAWILWHHTDDEHFYSFLPKSTGWELGKEHPAYPGAQRYLKTATFPKFPIRQWHTVRVRQASNVIDVWVDGRHIVKYTDRGGPRGDAPYYGGQLGLYTEAALIRYDDVSVSSGP